MLWKLETKQSTSSKHHLEEDKSKPRLPPSIPAVRGLSFLARRLGELGVGIRARTLSLRLTSQKMNSPWAFTLGWTSFKLEPQLRGVRLFLLLLILLLKTGSLRLARWWGPQPTNRLALTPPPPWVLTSQRHCTGPPHGTPSRTLPWDHHMGPRHGQSRGTTTQAPLHRTPSRGPPHETSSWDPLMGTLPPHGATPGDHVTNPLMGPPHGTPSCDH